MNKAFDFIARTADGVFAVDAGQKIVLWNAAAEEMLGFRAREVLGRCCYDVLCGTDENEVAVCGKRCAAIQAAARGEIVQTRELCLRTNEGRRTPVGVATVLLPLTRRDSSLLAHVFRPADRRMPLEQGPERALEDELTPRETQVLRLLARGTSTDRIRRKLEVRKSTVRTHIQHLLRKLGAHNRLEAVTLARRKQLL